MLFFVKQTSAEQNEHGFNPTKMITPTVVKNVNINIKMIMW